MSTTLAHYR